MRCSMAAVSVRSVPDREDAPCNPIFRWNSTISCAFTVRAPGERLAQRRKYRRSQTILAAFAPDVRQFVVGIPCGNRARDSVGTFQVLLATFFSWILL